MAFDPNLWLLRPEASRKAVLKELRDVAALWNDDEDPASLEDAGTLLAVVQLLESLEGEKAC